MSSTHQQFLATLPGFAGSKTYAPWPVWSASTRAEVTFQPMPKREAVKLWHRARDFDRQSKRKGCHGGAIGHTALQVLHSLIFDFLNFRTGRLDPSYAAIARASGVCERTVATALKRLKELRVLSWLRRCQESRQDGRYVLRQETNAYAVQPSGQWLGYVPPREAPPPAPGTWGAPVPMPSMLEAAATERRHGGTLQETARVLEQEPENGLAAALARLARSMDAAGRDEKN